MQAKSTLPVFQPTKWISIWLTTMIGLTVTAFAQGQAISITNAGFESNTLNCMPGPQCFNSFVLSGWTLIGQGATFKPSTGPGGEFSGGIPGGSNVASLGNDSGAGVITQDLGFAPSPNTTYTLTVYVGQRGDYPLTAYAVELLVGTTSVASDTTLRPATGTFALDKVSYSSGGSPGTGHLFIRLSGSGGGQADFDQVAVNAELSQPAITTQILPQLAFGGGWYTALYFTNITSTPVSFNVSFIGGDGNPLTVPALSGSSVTVNLAARGTAVTEIPNAGPLVQGYISAALPTGVAGYGVFRQSIPGVNDQEAVVPLSGTTATTSTLLFDDTKYVTGIAVVNLASVNATISVLARDNQGNLIGTSNIPLPAHAKTALVLRDLPGLAGVAGTRGSAEFTAIIGNLAALGLRFNGAAFTSIPTSDR
jgi:hypothetical protein